ncbi:hypothetical protein [Nocardia sp. NPDC049707]|uniref:hypothetical protein n=1 Tax=Nocardia sp. NPDC049707 TaxID=3154735 RepID=UPI003427D7A0
MTDRLTDERLSQLRDDWRVCTNAGERAMAAELLELRTAIARVTALADTWDNTTELDTGNRSIVCGAFASALRDALEGKRNG